MLKDKKLLVVIGIIILVIIMGQQDKKEAQADVNNAQISRVMPISIEANTPFTVTYQVSGIVSGSWGALIEDDISGGCNPSSINTGFLSPQPSLNIQVTAASSGTCAFTGNYIFAGSTEKQISGASSISITSPVSCTELKSSALNSIIAWSISQTTDARLAALSAISAWASSC